MIEITRWYLPNVTLGLLTFDDFEVFTCERPWEDNKPYVSCIPEGDYNLVRHDSPKFGDRVWMVHNVPDRTFILFHVANWPHQLQGCIAPGNTLFPDGDGVGSSRVAYEQFMEWSKNFDHLELRIRSGVPKEPESGQEV